MCVLCISNSINAQITVENSTPEDDKIEYVYYTDGSSNFDYNRLWQDYKNPDMQIDYCKAFIGQKILCIEPGYAMYPTCQIMDVEGGEFILQLRPGHEEPIEDFPVHKIATNSIIRPQISKAKDGNDEWWSWMDALMDKKGETIGGVMQNISCYISDNVTFDDRKRFFSQFLLIKGAYTDEEARQMIQESWEKSLPGKVYLTDVQKQIDKLEQKKKKGKIKPKELGMYQQLIEKEKFYKILRNGKEYYPKYNRLKGDTLILQPKTSLGDGLWFRSRVYLLVEDNKGQEYFISFRDGSGCITEKHFNRIKEQYVSQYVVEMDEQKVVGPIMKCEDIVLRDQALQAKLKDVKTGEISYATFSYMGSSCYYYSSEEYSREENGAYFFLDNYEIIVPEGL